VKLNDFRHNKPPSLHWLGSADLAFEGVIPAKSIRNDSVLIRTSGTCARLLYKRRMISSTYCFSYWLA